MKVLLAIAAAALLPAALGAQTMSDHDMAGMAHHQTGGGDVLHETGQSAFAAIAEATSKLKADPHTDWSKVNMEALRDHLVDMDNVVLRSNVVAQAVQGGARFLATSDEPRVRASIARMSQMHAAMGGGEGSDLVSVESIPGGIVMTVTNSNVTDQARIRALGFFGLLTEGMHHQRHHLMLAKGEDMGH